MHRIVVLVVLVSFFQIAQAQDKSFEPETTSEHVLFALSAMEDDSDLFAALSYLNEAIQMDSTEAFYYSLRGGIFFEMKKYDSALLDFDKAVYFGPGDFFNFFARAKCYYFLGDYQKSLKDLDQAVSMDPLDADVFLWRSEVRGLLGKKLGSKFDLRRYKEFNS